MVITNMRKNKKHINLYVPSYMRDNLVVIANTTDENLSCLIRKILSKYLESKKITEILNTLEKTNEDKLR